MTRKVNIEVAGVQTWYGTDEAGERVREQEETITVAVGTWSVRDGRDFLLYDEETADGPIRTLIKLSPGRLEVERSGAVRSRLELTPGKTGETWYETPAGRLGLKIRTSILNVARDDDCLRTVCAEYELVWGDEMSVFCRLEVRVSEVMPEPKGGSSG